MEENVVVVLLADELGEVLRMVGGIFVEADADRAGRGFDIIDTGPWAFLGGGFGFGRGFLAALAGGRGQDHQGGGEEDAEGFHYFRPFSPWTARQ